MRFPFRGILAGLLLIAAVPGLSAILRSLVGNRLRLIDPEASFEEMHPGTDAVFLGSVSMPGKGLLAESVWVFITGLPFHPEPSGVVISGGIYDPSTDQWAEGTESGSERLFAVSIQDIFLEDGTVVHGFSGNSREYASFSGPWGRFYYAGSDEGFTASFLDVTGFPLDRYSLPSFMEGHSFSGYCSGPVAGGFGLSGEITSLDGEPVSAAFLFADSAGEPRAEFALDFSQVAGPAMNLLDSLSAGAVMAAVPSGSLQVVLSDQDTLRFTTNLDFDSILVFDEKIAPDTFSTEAFLFCAGSVCPGDNSLRLDTGLLRLGSAEASFSMDLSWSTRRRMVLRLWNDSLAGSDLTGSVPPELLGRLRGLTLGGSMAFDLFLVLDWDHSDSCDVNIAVDASRLTVPYSPVGFHALSVTDGGASCTMRDSWGNTRTIYLDTLHNQRFVVCDSLPSFFEPLLCCAEDATFRRHHGFSEYHIRNSIRADIEAGEFVRGGSTLSMQLAKNLFLGREKTFARKLQEVFLTWRMEIWLSKDRMLELYANIVELGPDVFGFDEAGRYYFGKTIGELSVREMAFLVSILPGPSVYHRYAVQGRLPCHWDAYVERLLTICGSRGWLEHEVVREALSDTLIFSGPVAGY